MSFFTNLRADRLIAEIKAADDSDGHKSSLEKLVRLGASAIPRILDALASADNRETAGFVAVLTALLDNKSFPAVASGLTQGNQRTVAGAATALSNSRNYPANLLFGLLDQPAMPKGTVVGILTAQKSRLNAREVLQRAYNQDAAEKAAMFRIVSELADASIVPELLSRLEGKDPIARTHIINILARFNKRDVAASLQRQLKDTNKFVRQAVLNALAGFEGNVDVGLLCEVLRDPDVETQQKAIDAVVRANHPETMRHLIAVLRDEDENARRAAVEVLNEIGTVAHVKELLQSIKDDDWWVRSRAADALAKIGGPRVIEAALELIRDQDEDIRRAAIEILNQTKDERAIGFLIEATRDSDWWVRERAVDALAEIGSPRALPSLLELLRTGDERSLPTVARAIGKLGDPAVIPRLMPLLASPSKEARLEIITALARLVDDNSADAVRARLESFSAESADPTVSHAAMRAVEDMDARFSTGVRDAQQGAARMVEPSRTLLAEKTDFEGLAREAAPAQRLDISALKPGDVLEGRYKYLQKIGKGAFGTVLLMEDTVVDERLVLKFLNPNVSQDEEMMKRFVHELRYSRKITHRNVIRIYDFLFIRGNYAISMEYFPSHTLGHEIGDKPLPVDKAVRFAMDVATGMSVAHQSGIIHRDLKPANVLIDDTGLLKIVDFGVAAAQHQGDTQLTKTGYVIGSPKYMAPEQILGKKVDERADVYSLGVILYEMLTGEPPYHRGDHMAVMYQHVQGKAKPPIEVNPNIPPGLSEIVTKAMTVDKARRFQTMDELRSALERYL
ncbi:MAG: HEAT repeat domain-containing protein [Steroidobacteraceae bacterium]|nr:HEAT repeat domain-containing protein [Steroidobacteraceae bacterium]MBP9129284.1 HEAT repeat domain-containing protein [Steroidobacteraceae bacterium]